MINPDICSCCGEIWNRQNLKKIPLGKHELYLCPDCYAEYIKPLGNIKSEIEEIYINVTYQENKDRKATWGLRKALKIIDKYGKEQKEITEG